MRRVWVSRSFVLVLNRVPCENLKLSSSFLQAQQKATLSDVPSFRITDIWCCVNGSCGYSRAPMRRCFTVICVREFFIISGSILLADSCREKRKICFVNWDFQLRGLRVGNSLVSSTCVGFFALETFQVSAADFVELLLKLFRSHLFLWRRIIFFKIWQIGRNLAALVHGTEKIYELGHFILGVYKRTAIVSNHIGRVGPILVEHSYVICKCWQFPYRERELCRPSLSYESEGALERVSCPWVGPSVCVNLVRACSISFIPIRR